jgi:hypothetical protein
MHHGCDCSESEPYQQTTSTQRSRQPTGLLRRCSCTTTWESDSLPRPIQRAAPSRTLPHRHTALPSHQTSLIGQLTEIQHRPPHAQQRRHSSRPHRVRRKTPRDVGTLKPGSESEFVDLSVPTLSRRMAARKPVSARVDENAEQGPVDFDAADSIRGCRTGLNFAMQPENAASGAAEAPIGGDPAAQGNLPRAYRR